MMDLPRKTAESAQLVRPMLTKPVVLVGMMGSGKSHAGALLAKALGVPHKDSDTLIEQEAGRKIADIFSGEGEGAFRLLERNTIVRLLAQGVSVISTGGGCLTVPETAHAIHKGGLSVWLRAAPDVLYERVKHAKHRPLINRENPRELIEALLAEREPLYARADLVVDDPLEGVEVLVLAILTALERYVQ